MILNGVLGGLVGITASADVMGITDALLIGGISGILIVFSVAAGQVAPGRSCGCHFGAFDLRNLGYSGSWNLRKFGWLATTVQSAYRYCGCWHILRTSFVCNPVPSEENERNKGD